MNPLLHEKKNAPEFREVRTFLRLEWVFLEEWNDALQQVALPPHPVGHSVAVVSPNHAASEMSLERVQNLHIAFVLHDGELRKNLIARLHVGMFVDPYVKAALTVHEPADPFCLEIHWPAPNVKSLRVPAAERAFPADRPRVRWIVTEGASADEYQTVLEEFPAYGSVLLRLAKFLTLGPL